MSSIEKNMQQKELLPEMWLRYICDILTIVPKTNIDTMVNTINTLHPKITFTQEMEENSNLPFLDLIVMRFNGHLSFDINRKPMSTQQTIPSISCCQLVGPSF